MSDSLFPEAPPLICVSYFESLRPQYLLYYRAFLCLYLPAVCIWLAVWLDDEGKFFGYLSNWSTIIASIYALSLFSLNFASMSHIQMFLSRIRSNPQMSVNSHTLQLVLLTRFAAISNAYELNRGFPAAPDPSHATSPAKQRLRRLLLLEKAVIVLQSLTTTLLVTIVLSYWLTQASIKSFDFLNLQYHGLTCIFVLIDYFMCCNPGVFWHFLFSFVLMSLYWLFNILTFFLLEKGNTWRRLYPFLDYNEWYYVPLVFLVSFVLTALIHYLLIYMKKRLFAHNLRKFEDPKINSLSHKNLDNLENLDNLDNNNVHTASSTGAMGPMGSIHGIDGMAANSEINSIGTIGIVGGADDQIETSPAHDAIVPIESNKNKNKNNYKNKNNNCNKPAISANNVVNVGNDVKIAKIANKPNGMVSSAVFVKIPDRESPNLSTSASGGVASDHDTNDTNGAGAQIGPIKLYAAADGTDATADVTGVTDVTEVTEMQTDATDGTDGTDATDPVQDAANEKNERNEAIGKEANYGNFSIEMAQVNNGMNDEMNEMSEKIDKIGANDANEAKSLNNTLDSLNSLKSTSSGSGSEEEKEEKKEVVTVDVENIVHSV